MVEDREDSPDALKAKHLRELVQSEGWKLFIEHVEATWSPAAQIQRLDRAFMELDPGDEPAERMTGLQIRAAAKAIMSLVSWPAEAIGMAQPKQRFVRPFDMFRRSTGR